jgi:malonyl-CoA O-methyltransferase
MNIKREFSKYANEYKKLNIIQKKIIKRVAPLLDNQNILDLGCGNGAILEFVNPKNYTGIDFSEEMLKLHPSKNIYNFDFNTNECWEFIKKQNFDILVSLSALQWAENLEFIFTNIKNLNKNYILAIFTSNTFKTLHKTANITSPIHSKKEILEKSRILNPKIEIINYQLEFENSLEMLRYIKKSGVSSGEKKLSYKEIKRVIENYPFNYLEFEIVILKSKNMREKHHSC